MDAELKARKQVLEDEIFKLIDAFNRETKTTAYSVSVEYMNATTYMGEHLTLSGKVSVDVKLLP